MKQYRSDRGGDGGGCVCVCVGGGGVHFISVTIEVQTADSSIFPRARIFFLYIFSSSVLLIKKYQSLTFSLHGTLKNIPFAYLILHQATAHCTIFVYRAESMFGNLNVNHSIWTARL